MMGWKIFGIELLFVVLILLGAFVEFKILQSVFMKKQPTIVCESGYQLLVSPDSGTFHLVDKKDKKIPCR